MKKVFISQSNYIPWKGYFDAINYVDEFIIYDDVQYTKNDWRNRNKIKTAQGTQWLTIPIEVKGKLTQKINESKVSKQYLNWRKIHWNAVSMNYSQAPYFNEYRDLFENLYLRENELYLSRINYSFITVINKILQIKTPVRWSSEFNLCEGRNERLFDLCRQIGTTDYYSGPSAQCYLDHLLFNEGGINIHYFDYSQYPKYGQLHGDYINEVSILDLIFNEGSNAKNYLKSFSNSFNFISQIGHNI